MADSHSTGPIVTPLIMLQEYWGHTAELDDSTNWLRTLIQDVSQASNFDNSVHTIAIMEEGKES